MLNSARRCCWLPADILVGMRDGVAGSFELVWRPQAKVSVFDSAFMLGDGVWEGIRCHRWGCSWHGLPAELLTRCCRFLPWLLLQSWITAHPTPPVCVVGGCTQGCAHVHWRAPGPSGGGGQG